ncbi:MAG: SDR family NAD(P)-dependent oxidoreductase [Proteobacteria bacterium]|nr:SDR family NAD(P)-dependent oxidoreductase [Pseudomonadota bacterium]
MILRFPEDLVSKTDKLSNDLPHYQLNDHNVEGLEKIFKKISGNHGIISDFVHFHPYFAPIKNGVSYFDQEREIIKLVFFMAKYLKDSLTGGAGNSFMTVTQLDGYLGCGQKSLFSAYAGGLFGLVKTLNIEWNNVFCRAVDIDPKCSSTIKSEIILNEFFDYDSTTVEIGHSNGKRHTLKGVHQELSTHDSSTINPINAESVFIVTGGGKGVTAECTIKLAEKYACKFILLGRSDITVPEPQWAHNVSDEMKIKKHFMEDILKKGEKPTPVIIQKAVNNLSGNREIKNTIKTIEKSGAYVEYLSIDITNEAALLKGLSPILKKFGKVTGIIHGAGVLADKLIEKKSEQDFESVIGPKVDGLVSLLSCIPVLDLDTVVLFSSSAGFYGNEAQADYALANEILNKTARLIQIVNPDCHSIAYNWGPWDGGMVNEQLKKMFNERNIEIIPLKEGAGMLGDDLHSSKDKIPQIIVGGSMVVPVILNENRSQTVHLSRNLNLEENAFIKDHKINHDAVLPVVSALSWMSDSCLKLYPGYSAVEACNVRVFNGVVLSDSEPKEFNVEIKDVQKSNKTGIIDLEVKISSANRDGKKRFHYSCNIQLSKSGIEAGKINPHLLDASTVNEDLNPYLDKTLFHTGVFQEIKEIGTFTDESLVLKCKASEVPVNDLGLFQNLCFNSVADDTLLQAMLVWVRKYYQAGSLPLLINKVDFYKPIPSNKDFWVVLEVIKHSSSKMIGNITSCDSDGTAYTRFSGAEVTISKALNNKF